MSIITSIFGGGVGKVFDGIGSIIGKFVTDPTKKLEAEMELAKLQAESEKLLEQSFQAEMDAKKSIIVAELQQGDNFTKRMRPMMGYFGMFVIFYNYSLIPTIQYIRGMAPAPFNMPDYFWMSWLGIMATYSIGRTMEKRGASNGFTKLVTGR
jgi:hypothetical protein